MMQPEKNPLGIPETIIQTSHGETPAELAWVCEVCGPQPPIKLSGNRWVKRTCACQRAARMAQRYMQAAIVMGEQVAKQGEAAARSLTRLGALFPPNAAPATPPPAALCWTCHVCGPVAPLFLPQGRWIKRSCACQRQERAAREEAERRAAWAREQSYRTFGGWLGERWVDTLVIREMRQKTFESYDASRQLEAYEKAFAFAQRPRGNLLFFGDYGVGKTHLEAAICNSLRDGGRQLPDGTLQPMTSVFVTAPQFFMAYEETRKAFDQTNHIRLVQQVTDAPVLVFDDIDKSRPKEERWEVYWHIFDARCTAKRPTILSTNKREELDLYIGEASLSRLSSGLVAVKMVGDDFRREEER